MRSLGTHVGVVSVLVASAVAATTPVSADVGEAGAGQPLVEAAAAGVPDATFAVFGDYGDDSPREAAVAALVDSLAPDFIVTTGDNLYSTGSPPAPPGTYPDNVGAYYGAYIGGAVNRFFPSPGNTDYTDPAGGIGEYLSYFDLPGAGTVSSNTSGSELYYDVIQGSVHIFVLDSDAILSDPAEATAQSQWLEAQLAASPTPWQVVVAHHPPFTSRKEQPYWSSQWPFAAWGADAVLSGHDHSYERFSVDGIPYFISGLGGRPPHGFPFPDPNSEFQYNAFNGTMLVTACEAGMGFEFHALTDGLVDAITIGAPCESPIPPSLEKYVGYFDSGGIPTWVEADSAPGVSLAAGAPVWLGFEAQNVGDEPLINVALTDTTVQEAIDAQCAVPEVLAPGEGFTCVVGAFGVPVGQHTNTATLSAEYDGVPVAASDSANVFGTYPGIGVRKYVGYYGPGGAATWDNADAPPGPELPIGSDIWFAFQYGNLGNVSLDNVSLTDPGYDAMIAAECTVPSTLDPGQIEVCLIGPLPVEAGLQVNTATITGQFGSAIIDTDDAHYTGVP